MQLPVVINKPSHLLNLNPYRGILFLGENLIIYI